MSVGKVIVAPWPQCEALQTLEKPLAAANRPAIDIGSSAALHERRPAANSGRSPIANQLSSMSLIFRPTARSCTWCSRAGWCRSRRCRSRRLSSAAARAARPKFTVSAPFGREMIIAIASRSPLFDHALPQQADRTGLSQPIPAGAGLQTGCHHARPGNHGRHDHPANQCEVAMSDCRCCRAYLLPCELHGVAAIPAVGRPWHSRRCRQARLNVGSIQTVPSRSYTTAAYSAGVGQGGGDEQPLSVNLYVNFDFNSADLTSDARITLDQFGAACAMRSCNFQLCHRRPYRCQRRRRVQPKAFAAACRSGARYTCRSIRHRGRTALTAKGYGKSQLLDPEHPEDGVNRRVQIINTTAPAAQHN